MSWLRAIPFLFTLLAFVLQPASASAFGPAHPEARVSAFELVAMASVGASAETSPGLHEGIGEAYDENASGYRFAARGTPKALPAPRTRGNPIGERGTFYVDSKGDVIPTPPGGRITGSPAGRFIQARDAAGKPTGVRVDGPHRPATHPDPRAQQPGVTNPDGTPWLPINQ